MSNYTGTDNLEVMAEAINYNQFLNELVLKYANKNDKILDFGAGIGTFARRVHEAGYSVECIESDPAQADTISQSGLQVYTSIDDVPDQSCDYIYSLNVLEHIEDDAAITRALYNKLKPGGTILIYVPAMQLLFSSMDRKVQHYRRYSKSSLRDIADSSGLDVDYIHYADCAGFFATLAYKLFGSDRGDINLRSLIIYDRLVFPLSRLFDGVARYLFGKNVYMLARRLK